MEVILPELFIKLNICATVSKRVFKKRTRGGAQITHDYDWRW